ncbi:retroviral-like aspartic protease family protein [bacterium]|nr:retroviral-like aspartic protease family protein [bacterium]
MNKQLIIDAHSGLIVLDTEVKGIKTRFLKMALDTGCTLTVIPWNIAITVGCDPARSKETVKMVTGSGIEFAPVVTLKSLKALGQEVKNINVVCHNLPEESLVDGLLGLNFLSNFDILIKFREGILKIV